MSLRERILLLICPFIHLWQLSRASPRFFHHRDRRCPAISEILTYPTWSKGDTSTSGISALCTILTLPFSAMKMSRRKIFRGIVSSRKAQRSLKHHVGQLNGSESGINHPEHPLLHSWDRDVQRTLKGTTFYSAGTSLAAGPGRGGGVEKSYCSNIGGQQEGSRISIKNI